MGEDFGRSIDWIRNALWTSYHPWTWYQWTINSHGNNGKFGQIHSRYPLFSSYESTVRLWRICISDKQKGFTYRSPNHHNISYSVLQWGGKVFWTNASFHQEPFLPWASNNGWNRFGASSCSVLVVYVTNLTVWWGNKSWDKLLRILHKMRHYNTFRLSTTVPPPSNIRKDRTTERMKKSNTFGWQVECWPLVLS